MLEKGNQVYVGLVYVIFGPLLRGQYLRGNRAPPALLNLIFRLARHGSVSAHSPILTINPLTSGLNLARGFMVYTHCAYPLNCLLCGFMIGELFRFLCFGFILKSP